MNVWGKVLAVFVVIAGLASMALTAKFITVRNSWAAKTQPFAKNYLTAAADVPTGGKACQGLRPGCQSPQWRR